MSSVRAHVQSSFLAFSRKVLNSATAPTERGRVSVVVVKPFQNRTENGMCGHQVWNAFALVSSIRRLLNDKTYRRVITRNGPVSQMLKDMGVAVQVSRLSLQVD